MSMTNTLVSESFELPVDEPLIASESGYEVLDGQVVYVPPADEPHARLHAQVVMLLGAHVRPGFLVACDMLTRTAARDNFAPDASVYPAARDPQTGRRQLEVLAFEVVSTQTLAAAGTKAGKLSARGVRRVFAIDVGRGRVLEWSRAAETWSLLAAETELEDEVLATPLPIGALVDTIRADHAIAEALVARRHPVIDRLIERERSEGREEGVIDGLRAAVRRQLVTRFGTLGPHHEVLLAAADRARLEQLADRVISVASVDAVFGA
jgi:Uma2 family endonuclease